MTAYVHFADSTETVVTQEFSGPQDPEIYPNQGEVDDSDPRYLSFLALINPPAPDAVSVATAERDRLMGVASQAMTPLLVSLQLGDATDEEIASAKAWQAYTRALKVVDLTATDPAWPTVPA